MKKALYVAALCTVAHLTQAGAATISIGDYLVPEGTTLVDISVYVTGGEQVSAMEGIAIVHDGGTVLGNSPVPEMVEPVSYTGAIWETSPGGFRSWLIDGATTNKIFFPNVQLDASGESVAADGLLYSFTLNVTGRVAGESCDLRAGDPSLQETALAPLASVSFDNGSITITPVLEPGTMMLVVFAAVSIAPVALRWRWG